MAAENINSTEDRHLSIMTKLKNDTKAYHAQLESLPYFKLLIAHSLTLDSYVNQLSSLAIIHGVLEDLAASSQSRHIKSVWHDSLRKRPLLEKDLAFFAPRGIQSNSHAINLAHAMTGNIRRKGLEDHLGLLGYLYVMEGTTLGNSMHRPDILATFHLPEAEGNCYYSSYKDQVQVKWREFSSKMNETLDDVLLHPPVITAAREAFQDLHELYSALSQTSKDDRCIHITGINPEAGNHPMPDDEQEIQAALRASKRGWEMFPYYRQRYGERGKRFCDSDTCWIVTLTALGQEKMQKQVDWLCRVLACRGMPTFMMERTLEFLYEELIAAVPEKSKSYEILQHSAHALKNTRERCIPETSFRSLAQQFDQFAAHEMAEDYNNTGSLLVSSVVDEHNGLTGTVKAIQEWLTDEKRFSQEWVAAVNETIEKTRSIVSNS